MANTKNPFPRNESLEKFRQSRLALRKLTQQSAATVLNDLLGPPGNRVEALKGGLAGRHSIRINDQWRICFVWKDGQAHEVEIIDYH